MTRNTSNAYYTNFESWHKNYILFDLIPEEKIKKVASSGITEYAEITKFVK